MKKVTLSGGKMAYRDEGEGTPVLYIHGLGAAGTEDFPHLFPWLPNHRHIAPDLFGFGYSDRRPAEGYGCQAQAESLFEFLTAIGVKSIHVVAHSMGGAVALELYQLHPECISSLILGEANYQSGGGNFSRGILETGSREQFIINYHAWLGQFESTPEHSLTQRQFAKTLALADPEALYRHAEELVTSLPFSEDLVCDINVPLLWVVGENSWNVKSGDIMKQWGIPVKVIPNAGHGMILDQPKVFAHIMRSFLTL